MLSNINSISTSFTAQSFFPADVSTFLQFMVLDYHLKRCVVV